MNGLSLFDDDRKLAVFCPGCHAIHVIPLIDMQWDGATLRDEDGDLHQTSHTFADRDRNEHVLCSYNIENGQIVFGDCEHALANTTQLLDQAPPPEFGPESFGWN